MSLKAVFGTVLIGYLAIGALLQFAIRGEHLLNPFAWLRAVLWLPGLLLWASSILFKIVLAAVLITLIAGGAWAWTLRPRRLDRARSVR